MNALAIQIAFTLPLTLPLAIGISALRPVWLYPAVMIALGAHYLPFVFLYGMRMFAGLCAALVTSGVAIGHLYVPKPISLGAWLTTALLVAFAFVGRQVAPPRQHRSASDPTESTRHA